MTGSSYSAFASVYDSLMEDIPYNAYAELVRRLAGPGDGRRLLDIGCGTGVLSAILAKAGYSVTGIDSSPDMLTIARDRFSALDLDGQFFEQRMEALEGHEGFDVAVIAIDSLNYVAGLDEVRSVFRGVWDALSPGGHFIFDVHSPFKMTDLFLDGPFTADLDEVSYIWHTYPGDEPLSVESELSFFIRRPDGLYERREEFHLQRSFPPEVYAELLVQQGFSVPGITADWTDGPPQPESERLFFHAVK
ncbi:class I SAM-dependent DNA methyltransferase [Bhargavaea ullalensis]|uniref:SAM-dependent methyltransferase n=1 Tax=Bhargavaea ullalensis TaxID=1265685 RepID=A0ABV2G8U0_9BACL